MPANPRYEVRVTLLGDSLISMRYRLQHLAWALPPQKEIHLTGFDDRGVSYIVDVFPVEVVSEPPAKGRA